MNLDKFVIENNVEYLTNFPQLLNWHFYLHLRRNFIADMFIRRDTFMNGEFDAINNIYYIYGAY